MWYLKKIGWLALMSFAAGVGVFLLQGWLVGLELDCLNLRCQTGSSLLEKINSFYFFWKKIEKVYVYTVYATAPPRNVSLKREKGKRQQIVRTRAKSQRIVAQRPLSRVQYPVLYLSRIQRICLSRYLNLLFGIDCAEFCSTQGRHHIMILDQPKLAFAYTL